MTIPSDPQESQPPPAYGYRGPGTDLGEDIRRGYVEREGADPFPPSRRSDEGLASGGWGRRLRENWRGLWRRVR